jgi:dihydropteroate synthase
MPTLLMGIVNVTPDSFSDGNLHPTPAAAVRHALRLAAEGAQILDIGGESTRPYAQPVPAEEELARVLPVLEALAAATSARLSIDTMKASVARAALRAGATLVNDVTALSDPEMAETVASHNAGIVLMHMRGTPQTMRELTNYTDLIADIKSELAPKIEAALRAGIHEIYIDPGIGFAKTPTQSFEILARLPELSSLGFPILVGPSRKSFLATLPGQERVEDRLEGTLAACVVAALHGAAILRVHDVAPCRKALDVARAVKGTPWTKSS